MDWDREMRAWEATRSGLTDLAVFALNYADDYGVMHQIQQHLRAIESTAKAANLELRAKLL